MCHESNKCEMGTCVYMKNDTKDRLDLERHKCCPSLVIPLKYSYKPQDRLVRISWGTFVFVGNLTTNMQSH